MCSVVCGWCLTKHKIAATLYTALNVRYVPKLMPGFNIGCDANHQINATKIELNILYTVDIVISQNITANSSFMEGYIDGTFQCGSFVKIYV